MLVADVVDASDAGAEGGGGRGGEVIVRRDQLDRGGVAPDAEQAMAGFEDRLTQIGLAVQEMRNTVQGTPGGRTGDRREAYRERDVEESKAISNLPVFQGGERGVYKEWHEQFLNVFTQVRKGTRSLLEELETTKEEYWAEMDFDTWSRNREAYEGKYESWSADLWWVLIEKTSGEALQRVKGTKRGE